MRQITPESTSFHRKPTANSIGNLKHRDKQIQSHVNAICLLLIGQYFE